MTLSTLQAELDALLHRVSDALVSIDEAATAEQADAALAEIDAACASLRDLRATLDALDVADLPLHAVGAEQASALHAGWTWERTVRGRLVQLAGHLTGARGVLERRLRGRRRQVHTVRAGETLQDVAARYLGSWTEWPRLARHNGLVPGATLAAGDVLEIPDRRAP